MALNFLVTGVKMLKKSLDKKKMKEGAKKFVGGDKDCLLYTSDAADE